MASFPKVATDFDAIIQADRQRRKNEELAKEIFGRNKQRDNKKKDDKRPGRTSTPTLASRMGVAKRSSSTSSNNPLPRLQNKPRSSLPGQSNRLAKSVDQETGDDSSFVLGQPQQTTQTVTQINSTGGLSIRGASGPFVVHASNFAPGTTAADIESALHPDTLYNGGISSLVSCKLVSTKPDIVAELVFTEKTVADNIIAKYNGQKADGRILRVELVRSGVGSMSKTYGQAPQTQRQSNRQHLKQQQQQQVVQEPVLDLEPEIEMTDENAMDDIEIDADITNVIPATNFNDEREAANRDRDRRDRDSRRDRDGNYNDKRPSDEERQRNDNRDRDHERDRDRDRNHNRDREYDRRDDRRGTMSSHYGNGVNPGGNNSRGGGGGFGGGYGGGGGTTTGGGYRGGRYDNSNNYGGGGGGGGGRGGYRGAYRGYR